MKWAHLPVEGGLYAQHPKMLGDWEVIMHIEAYEERRKQKLEEERRKRNLGQGRTHRASRSR